MCQITIIFQYFYINAAIAVILLFLDFQWHTYFRSAHSGNHIFIFIQICLVYSDLHPILAHIFLKMCAIWVQIRIYQKMQKNSVDRSIKTIFVNFTRKVSSGAERVTHIYFIGDLPNFQVEKTHLYVPFVCKTHSFSIFLY